MRKIQFILLFLAGMIPLALAGCGSSGSGGDQTAGPDRGVDPETGIAFVSAATCIDCHDDISFSMDLVAGYLEGKHVVHSSHITQASDPTCLECHDPLGDGPTLEPLIDPANVPADGLAAVGCENCHGAGGEHFGVGPIPVVQPGIDTCGQCHDELPDSHLTFHPEADFITTNYKESRHFTARVRNEAICSKCHTDEGGKLYKDVTNRTQLLAHVLPVSSDEPVQCRTCHDPHNAGKLLKEEVEDHGHVVASAEYATCTTCHMSDVEVPDSPDAPTNVDWMYHWDVYYRIITDTHYDDPATPALIEGYALDHHEESGHRACLDCHDVHSVEEIRADDDSSSFSNTINDQWSKSGHAGFIGDEKLRVAEEQDDLGNNRTLSQTIAIKNAGIDGEAFIHAAADGGWSYIGEINCQRCHTATGGMNFLKDPAAYEAALAAYELSGDPADAPNDYSYLVDWTPETGSGQNELIYCWTCHSDNAGGLIDPGVIPFPSGAEQSLADGSNVCMSCHQGRESGLSILAATPNDVVQAPTDYDSFNFINRHYFAAAAILFGADVDAQFEYRAKTEYMGQNTFAAHAALGIGLDTCVECHLRNEADHGFLPVLDDCTSCHSDAVASFEDLGLPFTPEVDYDGDGVGESFQGEINGFSMWSNTEVDKGLLYVAIQDYAANTLGLPIVYGPGSYPYFFNDTNGDGVADPGETIYPNRYRHFDSALLAAAYNFHSAQDPCSDIHNYKYVIQSLYDSLDDLDNGLQDNSLVGPMRP